MAELALEGQIIEIFEQQQITDTFTKREFVIETDDQYPQMVKFELVQSKCDLIDDHKKGESVKVHFNVRGRKWTSPKGDDKYFVSLNAWRIEGQSAATESNVPPPTEDDVPPVDDSVADDLPF